MRISKSLKLSVPLGLVLLACGKPAAPVTPADALQEEPTRQPEAAPADPDTDDELEEEQLPVSPEDLQAILQVVLNDGALQPYLDLGAPGHLPFKIAGPELPSSLELILGPDPVKIVEGPKDKKDAVLVLLDVDITAKKAYLTFRYDVSKLRGSASLEKEDHGWVLTTSTQNQR